MNEIHWLQYIYEYICLCSTVEHVCIHRWAYNTKTCRWWLWGRSVRLVIAVVAVAVSVSAACRWCWCYYCCWLRVWFVAFGGLWVRRTAYFQRTHRRQFVQPFSVDYGCFEYTPTHSIFGAFMKTNEIILCSVCVI